MDEDPALLFPNPAAIELVDVTDDDDPEADEDRNDDNKMEWESCRTEAKCDGEAEAGRLLTTAVGEAATAARVAVVAGATTVEMIEQDDDG